MATEKTVAVRLLATVAGYKSALRDAAQETRQFGRTVKDTGSSVRQTFADMGDDQLQKVGRAGLVAGGLVAVGFGLMVKGAMDFDKQMSEVGAVAGATGGELDALRQSALDAGKATVFSATEAAMAQAELAKAGLSTADILGGGLTGALDLAAAGSLDLATAAEIAANAMNQFNLEGDDVGHIADLLAAGANKSATDVAEMGMALKQGGAAASNMGISLEETVGLLGLFADNALKGSDGGTSMKTMLTSLAGVSGPARKQIADLGLTFFDASGQFLGLENAAEQLKQKLGPLADEQRSQALNTIFGTDAARAAIAMMEGGGAAVRQWTDDVDQSGYAAELAAQKNDNLAGDLEKLRGTIETALIEGGSKATGALRGMAQGFESVVTGLGEMPGPLQTAFMGATGLLGLGSAGIGIYGTLAPKIREVKDALTAMGGIGPTVASNLGSIGLAAGGAAAALGIMAWAMGEQAKEAAAFDAAAQKFSDAMKEAGGATADFNKELRDAFAKSDIGELLKDTDANLDVFTQGVRESGTELDEWQRILGNGSSGLQALPTYLDRAAESGSAFAQEILRWQEANGKTDAEVARLISGFDMLNDQVDTGAEKLAIENQMLGGLAEGSKDAADGTSQATSALELHTEATEEDIKALEKQQDAMMAIAGGHLGLQAAQIASRQALEEYNEQMKSAFLTADQRTAAGNDLLETYLREAEQTAAYAGEIAAANGVQLTNADVAVIQKTRLEELAGTLAPGSPLRAQLQGYIDTLALVPPQIATTVTLTMDSWKFWADAAAVSAWLGSLSEQQAIAAASTITGSRGDPNYKGRNRDGSRVQADGSVLDFYAAGGIRESHVAQIAPAGANRMWAEPETGGEAYIPLSTSKRPRSRAIWAETGRRLGMGSGGSTTNNSHSFVIQTNDVDSALRSGYREIRKQAIYAGGR